MGAWLAAQIGDGTLGEHILVPEGLDDMWLEDPSPFHPGQVSAGHLGPFRVRGAAGHILDLWRRHASTDPVGHQRLALVLEGGVEHELLHTLDRSLDECLAADGPLRRAIEGMSVLAGRRSLASSRRSVAAATPAVAFGLRTEEALGLRALRTATLAAKVFYTAWHVEPGQRAPMRRLAREGSFVCCAYS